MEWKSLLNPGRIGCPATGSDDPRRRLEAQRDYDRIIFSPAFRRLQGKTQVFPLPESDMTHTRLTHSLEVSCVARSLGWIAAERITGLKEHQPEVAAIVSAAALAHDLGNPPFGHSGEAAIGHYFLHGNGRELISDATPRQKLDLVNFEGNALGFRLVVDDKPAQTTNKGGYGLSCVTLAAFAKYPCFSDKVVKSSAVARKKFGVFHDNESSFNTVASHLSLSQYQDGAWHRHPLAFLTEAADDICYSIIDIEDGYKLGIVGAEIAMDLFRSIAEEIDQDLKGIEKVLAEDQRVGYLRSKAINSLIEQAVVAFCNAETNLLDGTRAKPLLDDCLPSHSIKRLKTLAIDKIYCHRPVIEIEAAGFKILPHLLDMFISAAVAKTPTGRDKKNLSLIPKQYLPAPGHSPFPKYTQILNICEYVASMTDDYAIGVYRILQGISLPNSGH